jgi:hypothetical protein
MTPIFKTACAAALLALSMGQAQAQSLDTLDADAADALFDAALAEAEACPVVFDLTAESFTQMDVFMLAPCRAGESVILDHAGMVLRLTASEQGALAAVLPILDADAPVTLTFADGTMADATLTFPISNVQDVAARW